MSAKPSLYAMILLLITVVTGPTISSVSSSPSNTTINDSSDYHIPNPSSNPPSIKQKETNNSTATFEITDKLKAVINDHLDKNKTNAAIAIGFVDPNGTQFYGHGKMSNSSNATVD